MATVNDILIYLETLCPAYMKEDWDNVGLLCGRRSSEVKRILVALDPFESVCREAEAMGADLLVTHHPLIFQAPNAITDDNSIGRSILLLAQHGISAINAHTNLDCAPGGVNDVLAGALGLKDVEIIDPAGVTEDGTPYGLLRCGYVEETDLDTFLAHVKVRLGTPVLRFAKGGSAVHKVAVGGGSCAGALRQVADEGCDTFVTADVKYNQFWDARELGLNLIDAGHFYTENPVVPVLAAALGKAFPEIEVKVSKNHRDCMEFA